MSLYNISRTRFFNILSEFDFVSNRVFDHGQTFVLVKLSTDEANRITSEFPSSIWEA